MVALLAQQLQQEWSLKNKWILQMGKVSTGTRYVNIGATLSSIK